MRRLMPNVMCTWPSHSVPCVLQASPFTPNVMIVYMYIAGDLPRHHRGAIPDGRALGGAVDPRVALHSPRAHHDRRVPSGSRPGRPRAEVRAGGAPLLLPS